MWRISFQTFLKTCCLTFCFLLCLWQTRNVANLYLRNLHRKKRNSDNRGQTSNESLHDKFSAKHSRVAIKGTLKIAWWRIGQLNKRQWRSVFASVARFQRQPWFWIDRCISRGGRVVFFARCRCSTSWLVRSELAILCDVFLGGWGHLVLLVFNLTKEKTQRKINNLSKFCSQPFDCKGIRLRQTNFFAFSPCLPQTREWTLCSLQSLLKHWVHRVAPTRYSGNQSSVIDVQSRTALNWTVVQQTNDNGQPNNTKGTTVLLVWDCTESRNYKREFYQETRVLLSHEEAKQRDSNMHSRSTCDRKESSGRGVSIAMFIS